MVLLHSKVPGEVGSRPPITSDPTSLSLWLGLFAAPVLLGACHTCPCRGEICCTAPLCHGVFLEHSIPVLCGFHGSFSKGLPLFLPLHDSGHCHTPASRRATNTNVSLSCCTAQAPSPLGTKHQTDPRLQMDTGITIMLISHYHNETQDRKEVAAHGTKSARCSQFLYSQL